VIESSYQPCPLARKLHRTAIILRLLVIRRTPLHPDWISKS
jgi:hypothetical protein